MRRSRPFPFLAAIAPLPSGSFAMTDRKESPSSEPSDPADRAESAAADADAATNASSTASKPPEWRRGRAGNREARWRPRSQRRRPPKRPLRQTPRRPRATQPRRRQTLTRPRRRSLARQRRPPPTRRRRSPREATRCGGVAAASPPPSAPCFVFPWPTTDSFASASRWGFVPFAPSPRSA